MVERAEPSASLAAPFVSVGTQVVLAILAVVGILGMILIAIGHPVFTMLVYIALSAAVVYYLAKVIKVKAKYKPLYILGSFFALLTLCIVAPSFMTLYPPTSFATTGEAALAQIDAGEAATQPQIALIFMQVIAASTFCGIAASRAKTTVQLIILSLAAAFLSILVIFGLLLV